MPAHQGITEKTDQELVRLTLADRENFLHIVNRYEGKLLRFILRITNVSLDDAKDLLQEVFIKAYQNLNGVDQSLSFSSWLYRVTRNHVISHYRKQRRQPQFVSTEFSDDILTTVASDLDISKLVDQQILKRRITEAVQRINPKYREVIILRYFEEKNYQEIADIVKKPPGTVATLLSRAKKQLRINLTQDSYGK